MLHATAILALYHSMLVDNLACSVCAVNIGVVHCKTNTLRLITYLGGTV